MESLTIAIQLPDSECNDPVTLHNRIAHINNNQERINYTLVNLSVLSFPPFIFITTIQINIYYYLFIIVTYNQLLYNPI